MKWCRESSLSNETSRFLLVNTIFMPLIIKCRGHYVSAYALVSVIIWFPSIIEQMPGSIDLWPVIGDNQWKVPFEDQLHRSSKMAIRAAILDSVSVD
jgi:hypothetical protein